MTKQAFVLIYNGVRRGFRCVSFSKVIQFVHDTCIFSEDSDISGNTEGFRLLLWAAVTLRAGDGHIHVCATGPWSIDCGPAGLCEMKPDNWMPSGCSSGAEIAHRTLCSVGVVRERLLGSQEFDSTRLFGS